MRMKRLKTLILLIIGIVCASSAQIAVKTNVPLDVLRLPNAAVEVALTRKFTADLTGYYSKLFTILPSVVP